MSEHEIRVVEEKAALDEKICKLKSFLDRPVTSIQDVLLQRQLAVMLEYSQILEDRINDFKLKTRDEDVVDAIKKYLKYLKYITLEDMAVRLRREPLWILAHCDEAMTADLLSRGTFKAK